ncbi:MAG: serine hydroxymethyltransferase [Candidatus Aminicenantes bacterium]
MSTLYEKVQSLTERVEKNNNWRQKESINLIPSETTPSLLVKMCEISDPSGRYAEHRTMKGKEIYFYQGTDFIREVEEELREEMRRYFGCTEVELRPVSGQMANEVVFKGMVRFLNRDRPEGKPMRKMKLVMNNALTKGGHLSSQPMGALFNYVEENPRTGKENVINFPVSEENPYKPDLEKLKDIITEHKPELLVFGKSMFIYQEPIQFVAELVKDWEEQPVVMYDMAHVLGLYGAMQRPLEEGADVITGSTHKTFFGPQRGMVAGNFPKGSRMRKLWLDIKSRAFPGSTSNHHLGTLLALLMAAYEMNEFKQEYQNQVRSNAKAFARALKEKGVPVEGDERDGFTETHQVLIRIDRFGNGMEIARRLEESNIVTNYQALPDDETFLEPSGIRMGVQEMTRFGMKEKDFEKLAEFIADVIKKNLQVKKEVKEFRQRFLEMQYCLSVQESLPLAARMIQSIFHYPDFTELFIQNLERNLKG